MFVCAGERSSHGRFSRDFPGQLVMVGFMADMLVSEYMTIDLDFISEVVLLVIDLRICLVLRSEVWREDSVPSM